MIHVRLTREELGMLRKGTVRQHRVPKTAGAHCPEPGVTRVSAYAPAEYERVDGRRERLQRRQTVACLVTAVMSQPDAWVVTFAPGSPDRPRFLMARSGRGDYTSELRLAMRDEPECVPESWERKLAATVERVERPVSTGRPWKRTA